MITKPYFVLLLIGIWLFIGCFNDSNNQKQPDVIIKTTLGDIAIILYDDTPKHRDNFLKLASEGFYDSLMFHRIIYEFMIQIGDPRTRNAISMQDTTLGDDPGYTLEAEISDNYIHTFGKLAAARYPDNVNPEWRSSGSQFYIVTGASISKSRLDSIEIQYDFIRKEKIFKQYQVDVNNKVFEKSFNEYLEYKGFKEFKYSKEQREAYYNEGGAPWLDFQYTIFGEVIRGFNIANKIASVQIDQYNRPMKAIRIISIEIMDKEPSQ